MNRRPAATVDPCFSNGQPESRSALLVSVAWTLATAPAAQAWAWPADGEILRAFSVGDDPYAGGQHRGVDLALGDATSVRAPAAGEVTFAGTVPTHGRTVTIADVGRLQGVAHAPRRADRAARCASWRRRPDRRAGPVRDSRARRPVRASRFSHGRRHLPRSTLVASATGRRAPLRRRPWRRPHLLPRRSGARARAAARRAARAGGAGRCTRAQPRVDGAQPLPVTCDAAGTARSSCLGARSGASEPSARLRGRARGASSSRASPRSSAGGARSTAAAQPLRRRQQRCAPRTSRERRRSRTGTEAHAATPSATVSDLSMPVERPRAHVARVDGGPGGEAADSTSARFAIALVAARDARRRGSVALPRPPGAQKVDSL